MAGLGLGSGRDGELGLGGRTGTGRGSVPGNSNRERGGSGVEDRTGAKDGDQDSGTTQPVWG